MVTAPEGFPAVAMRGLGYRYGERVALDSLTLSIPSGILFGLLGPNGGGKTTLFRLLSTHFRVQCGSAAILGLDLATQLAAIRRTIGVVFQSPSLDIKLTVAENLRHHARLYGLSTAESKTRIPEMLSRLGVADRARDRVETLSGGLARRVEIAKGLLHRPKVLLMDEPTTGLDPGARRDVWDYLKSLRASGISVIVTTHLMEEAQRCDRLAILDHGKLVAEGEPSSLCEEIGGEVLTLEGAEPQVLLQLLRHDLGLQVQQVGNQFRVEHPDPLSLVSEIRQRDPQAVSSLAIAKPSLEDVFLKRTGHRFWGADDDA